MLRKTNYFNFFLLLVISFSSFATEIRSVRVGGDKEVKIELVGAKATPSVRVVDNQIELTFTESKLSESLQGKLDIDSPHALIRRISLFENAGSVKALIVVNGSVEGLKNRLNLTSSADGVQGILTYPKAESATLALLKEEQEPLVISEVKKEGTKFPKTQVLFSLIVIIFAGVATFFFMRFLKTKGKWKGSRKFLIEQLGYCPMGAKTGVSLIKVGKEFVLVGVTPNQVTYLSSLPKLAEQYEEESQLERSSFREAIQEGLNQESAYGV